MDLIFIRCDYEVFFFDRNESKIKLDFVKRFFFGLRLVDVFVRWFDIYDFGWFKILWNIYLDIGLFEIYRIYDIIFVYIVNRVVKVNFEFMNFRIGDYDEILWCMRVIYVFVVLMDDVYDFYEKELIELIRDRYEEILFVYMEEDDIFYYGLWDIVYYEGYINFLEYVNLLIGD